MLPPSNGVQMQDNAGGRNSEPAGLAICGARRPDLTLVAGTLLSERAHMPAASRLKLWLALAWACCWRWAWAGSCARFCRCTAARYAQKSAPTARALCWLFRSAPESARRGLAQVLAAGACAARCAAKATYHSRQPGLAMASRLTTLSMADLAAVTEWTVPAPCSSAYTARSRQGSPQVDSQRQPRRTNPVPRSLSDFQLFKSDCLICKQI